MVQTPVGGGGGGNVGGSHRTTAKYLHSNKKAKLRRMQYMHES